jgi:hypothetical protein
MVMGFLGLANLKLTGPQRRARTAPGTAPVFTSPEIRGLHFLEVLTST